MVGNIATMERDNIGYAAHITLLLLYITFASLDFVCAYACMFCYDVHTDICCLCKEKQECKTEIFYYASVYSALQGFVLSEFYMLCTNCEFPCL